ncbi:hypothetical protein FB451DRAFT_1552634 [Mycena latifolia]|nr:hypothetical protein FB451DRAFT_1552634 [Mycena latifolia]
MHLISTINPKTQSVDDVPVVLVNLEGKRKFLPRPETHEDLQRLVRAHYGIDPHAALLFEVSTWDVCAGQNVEVTEAAYALLAPFMDNISVVVESGRDRVMPTPSATPPLHRDDAEDEQSVREQLEQEFFHVHPTETPSRRAATRPPKVESEEEEEVMFERYGERHMDATSVQDDEKEDHARQVPKKESRIQNVQPKEEPMPKERGETSKRKPVSKPREAATRSDYTSESSQQTTTAEEERFNVLVSGPRSDHKEREFKTRGGHLVRKVLDGACKTFELDANRAKLMLYVPMLDDDGEETVAEFECDNEETMARSGVKPYSRLVVRLVEDEEEEEDYEDDD